MYMINCSFQVVIRFPHTMSARVTAIITCLISALGLMTAVVCNTLFILAFARTGELRTYANLFVVSLSCTDLLVGSVVEPLYITRQALALSGTDDCGVWVTYLTMALICTGASFHKFTSISCEKIRWLNDYAGLRTKSAESWAELFKLLGSAAFEAIKFLTVALTSFCRYFSR